MSFSRSHRIATAAKWSMGAHHNNQWLCAHFRIRSIHGAASKELMGHVRFSGRCEFGFWVWVVAICWCDRARSVGKYAESEHFYESLRKTWFRNAELQRKVESPADDDKILRIEYLASIFIFLRTSEISGAKRKTEWKREGGGGEKMMTFDDPSEQVKCRLR